jgi:hypothetical protein
MIFFTVIVLMLSAPAGARADGDRDPFETSVETTNPYRYRQAVELLTVKGIIRTESDRRIIMATPDLPGLAVLKEGDEIAVRYQGISHRFTVIRINARDVRFHARSGTAHEVRIQ